MVRLVFKISVGFVTGALILLAVSLYLSNLYLKEQLRLAEIGNLKGAWDKVQLAARLDPFGSEPLAARAYLELRQGHTNEAVEALQEAIARDPANYRNYAILGNVQRQQLGDPEAAAQSYRDALERNPGASTVVYGLGEALLSSGDLEGAKEQYEWLREQGNIPLRGLYNLGEIQTRLGEPEEAIKTFEEAKEGADAGGESLEDSQREQFLRSLELAIADALVVQGSYDEAREALLQSSSDQAPARLALLDDPESYRMSVLEGRIS
ncbi:MAG TPA: tetratricopeptide repeat protein [Rubrobacteraceae bacterium]|nr:tetratricopeptide repeat protein [Rubrobacteraceae bacterium]